MRISRRFPCYLGKKILEPGKEWRIVQGPLGGSVQVPPADWQAGSDGQPVSVHLKNYNSVATNILYIPLVICYFDETIHNHFRISALIFIIKNDLLTNSGICNYYSALPFAVIRPCQIKSVNKIYLSIMTPNLP
jgi:hypothetical protein